MEEHFTQQPQPSQHSPRSQHSQQPQMSPKSPKSPQSPQSPQSLQSQQSKQTQKTQKTQKTLQSQQSQQTQQAQETQQKPRLSTIPPPVQRYYSQQEQQFYQQKFPESVDRSPEMITDRLNNGTSFSGQGTSESTGPQGTQKQLLNSYIYDFLLKSNLSKTGSSFSKEADIVENGKVPSFGPDADKNLNNEADIPPDFIPMYNTKHGFLYEWWQLFWDLYNIKSNRDGSDIAQVYYQIISGQRQQEQMQRNISIQAAKVQYTAERRGEYRSENLEPMQLAQLLAHQPALLSNIITRNNLQGPPQSQNHTLGQMAYNPHLRNPMQAQANFQVQAQAQSQPQQLGSSPSQGQSRARDQNLQQQQLLQQQILGQKQAFQQNSQTVYNINKSQSNPYFVNQQGFKVHVGMNNGQTPMDGSQQVPGQDMIQAQQAPNSNLENTNGIHIMKGNPSNDNLTNSGNINANQNSKSSPAGWSDHNMQQHIATPSSAKGMQTFNNQNNQNFVNQYYNNSTNNSESNVTFANISNQNDNNKKNTTKEKAKSSRQTNKRKRSVTTGSSTVSNSSVNIPHSSPSESKESSNFTFIENKNIGNSTSSSNRKRSLKKNPAYQQQDWQVSGPNTPNNMSNINTPTNGSFSTSDVTLNKKDMLPPNGISPHILYSPQYKNFPNNSSYPRAKSEGVSQDTLKSHPRRKSTTCLTGKASLTTSDTTPVDAPTPTARTSRANKFSTSEPVTPIDSLASSHPNFSSKHPSSMLSTVHEQATGQERLLAKPNGSTSTSSVDSKQKTTKTKKKRTPKSEDIHKDTTIKKSQEDTTSSSSLQISSTNELDQTLLSNTENGIKSTEHKNDNFMFHEEIPDDDMLFMNTIIGNKDNFDLNMSMGMDIGLHDDGFMVNEINSDHNAHSSTKSNDDSQSKHLNNVSTNGENLNDNNEFPFTSWS